MGKTTIEGWSGQWVSAVRLVLGNLPPGGAYHCRRLREDYAAWLPGRRDRRFRRGRRDFPQFTEN